MALYCWKIRICYESNETLKESSKEDRRARWPFEERRSKRISENLKIAGVWWSTHEGESLSGNYFVFSFCPFYRNEHVDNADKLANFENRVCE